MNYTLYIDESGDFQSQRGQWIVSGVLFCEKYEECENVLKTKMKHLPQELELSSIRDFHLTEFRKKFDHKNAVEMAKKTLSKLKLLPFQYYFLATINYSKTSLSNREKTYRLMLSDMLALCETVLEENSTISKLDLIIATRTIDGILQTTISNVKKDIIDSLPLACEVDLATRGMVELIGKHINIKMDYANNSWGLVCADFIANLTYHNRKEIEKKYLDELENEQKYKIFESFGNFESRKANVASRDGDYITAIYRWIKILYKNEDNPTAHEFIQKNFNAIFKKYGTTGSLIAFKSIIEKFWRNHSNPNQYEELLKLLNILESELIFFFELNEISQFEVYLFKLRNSMLILLNHTGNTSDALFIALKQDSMVNKLAANPEFFELILDYKSIEIELYVNLLEISKAFDLAKRYLDTIVTFQEVWSLMTSEEGHEFLKSRAYIKAQMIYFRIALLNNKIDVDMNYLGSILYNTSDLSRFNNYKVMFYLKQDKPEMAIKYYLELLDKNDYTMNKFDFFWFLKSINEVFLNNGILENHRTADIIQKHSKNFNFNEKGHPADLILRELALFEFNSGNKSAALKHIRKAKEVFTLGNSPIGSWLMQLLDIHEDYFKNNLKNEVDYFLDIQKLDFYQHTIIKHNTRSFFKSIRFFSPY